MNGEHFQQQLERLRNTFGKTAYGEERVKLLWRAVKDFEDSWMTQVVDGFITSARQAPILADFSHAIAEARERKWKAEKVTSLDEWKGAHAVACDYCRDTGVFLCVKRESPDRYAFRCHCSKGCSDTRTAIPQFKRDHHTEGFYWIDIKPHGVQP